MRMPHSRPSTPLVAKIDAQRTLQQTLSEIEIIGSAGGAGFSEYWLEYGIGEVPELWYPLGTAQTKPRFNTCLHKWDTSTLAESRYTLRLSVKSENEEIARAKVVVDVRRKESLIVRHEAQPWLVGNKFNSVVMWQTEALATGEIQIVEANGNINRTAHSDAENLLHFVNISDLGVPSGTYLYRLAVEKSHWRVLH